MASNKTRKRNLTNPERQALFQELLKRSKDGKLQHGTIRETATRFNISERTVSRIWKRGSETATNYLTPGNVDSRKKGNSGRKKKSLSEIHSKIKAAPYNKRTTLRSLAESTGISKSTLHRSKKRGDILRHSSSIKPSLTHQNKMQRIDHALSQVTLNERIDEYRFNSMYNYVHIDEKWFYLLRENQSYYLTPQEEAPYRHTKSKRYIGKVMFICAVARPRYDHHRRKLFDGKIGIWPFVEKQKALRNSVNRPAGTMETKSVNVDKNIYREYLVTKIIPAIKKKFPFQRNKPVLIQQDNARPHVSPTDPELLQSIAASGKNIQLVCQPPNSPDFNVLDLGFFRSLQSMQTKMQFTDIDGLIASVKYSYEIYLSERLSDIFLTYQSVMETALLYFGHNNFKIPHKKKHQMTATEKLTHNITCDGTTVKEAQNYYNQS